MDRIINIQCFRKQIDNGFLSVNKLTNFLKEETDLTYTGGGNSLSSFGVKSAKIDSKNYNLILK